MERVIMIILSLGALIGGLDQIAGNRLGLGDKFEEGFRLLGSIALCQAGMICIAPLLASLLSHAVVPVFHVMRVDPGMFGSILAIDMGGYQMALSLAEDPSVGAFSGIIGAAMLGCTLTYTIPVGIGLIPDRLRDGFARGVMCGMIVLPVTLFFSGLFAGLSVQTSALCVVPVLLISLLLVAGLWKKPDGTIRAFSVFARGVRLVTTLGLCLGAFQSLSGLTLIPQMESLPAAMTIVSGIGIALLGSLPVAELLRRGLKKPLQALGKHTGIRENTMTAMLTSAINITPALVSMKDLDERGCAMTAAFAVCSASAFTAHLGFTASLEPQLVMPLLAGKLLGAVLGVALAWLMTRRDAALS